VILALEKDKYDNPPDVGRVSTAPGLTAIAPKTIKHPEYTVRTAPARIGWNLGPR
jgi:hypothetical protein